MAEILLKARDASNPDPAKDRAGCYKRGMPVVVKEDGHQWGASEGLPNFVILKLPGVSVAKVEQFIAPQDEQDGFEEDGTTPRMVTYRRRLWRVLVENLPASALNLFKTQGYVTIGGPNGDYTWTQFRNYVQNQRDQTLAPASL